MPEDKKHTVAKTLKQRRTNLKLSLAHVELATKIRGKYLVKLESGDYKDLPNDIYTKGFVAKYADFLGLKADDVVAQYVVERGGSIEVSRVGSLKPVGRNRLIVTPKILVAGAFLVLAGMVVAYLAWQFAALAAAPQLDIMTPKGDQAIEGNVIDIAGHASGGADVYINDSLVVTDGNGNFSGKLALQEGVNAIRITAKNKLGKITAETRNVLARLPKLDARATVPGEKFDGVAVGITIKDAATGLTVTVDDKEVFNGTMLAGTGQTFKGAKNVKITTNNAGATNILITNAQTASKNLGSLGAKGEIKRNIEFTKDTAFP